MSVNGVWLPIVTPFVEGEVDYESYEGLISHYISKGISGLMPLGTTGESPAVTEAEFEKILDTTVRAADGRVPVYAGVGGNHTDSVVKKLAVAERNGIDGILSVCPYYNRPGQEGLYRHFLKLSEATDLPIMIYNIPYRTGVNLHNETLLRLSEARNIVGVKDSCGDIAQSLELLANKPDGFSVMTGEDILYYTNLVNGGDGGILAAAHLDTEALVRIHERIRGNDHRQALAEWRQVSAPIPLLFAEPNPTPVKYCLQRLGLIKSAEARLPLTEISTGLAGKLDTFLK